MHIFIDNSITNRAFIAKLREKLKPPHKLIPIEADDIRDKDLTNAVFITNNPELQMRICRVRRQCVYLYKEGQNDEFLIKNIGKVLKLTKHSSRPRESTYLFDDDDDLPPDVAQYVNAFKELAKFESNTATKLTLKILWKLVSIILAAGGTFPFVVFGGEFAKQIFGDDEFLVIWSIISSGLVNFAITQRSLDQIPDLGKDLFRLTQKIISQSEIEYGLRLSRPKAAVAALLLVLVNIGSFFSNFEIAKDTSKEVPNAGIAKFLLIFQLIGATALVLRSTVNKPVSKSYPEYGKVAEILKGELLGELNGLLTKPLTDEAIDRLKIGKTTYHDLKYIKWALWTIPGVLTLVYAGAFGISAFDAAYSGSILSILYGSFSTVASTISKALLLEYAAFNVSGNLVDFVSGICGNEILHSQDQMSSLTSLLMGSALFTLIVWNTWMSGAEVVLKYLAKPVGELLSLSEELQIGFSAGVGFFATLPINFGDLYKIIADTIHSGKLKIARSDADQFVKMLMTYYSGLPTREFVNRFTIRGDIEAQYELIDDETSDVCGLVRGPKYHQLMEHLATLRQLWETEPGRKDLYYQAAHPRRFPGARSRLFSARHEVVITIRGLEDVAEGSSTDRYDPDRLDTIVIEGADGKQTKYSLRH